MGPLYPNCLVARLLSAILLTRPLKDSESEQESQHWTGKRNIRRFDLTTDVLFELDIQMPVTEV